MSLFFWRMWVPELSLYHSFIPVISVPYVTIFLEHICCGYWSYRCTIALVRELSLYHSFRIRDLGAPDHTFHLQCRVKWWRDIAEPYPSILVMSLSHITPVFTFCVVCSMLIPVSYRRTISLILVISVSHITLLLSLSLFSI